jgi:hypothetical protein
LTYKLSSSPEHLAGATMFNKSHSFLLFSILILGPAHDVLGHAGWRQSLPTAEETDI